MESRSPGGVSEGAATIVDVSSTASSPPADGVGGMKGDNAGAENGDEEGS